MLSQSTLYDLDVFTPAHTNKASLWKQLNYCRTEGGQSALKDIISLKEHSLEHTRQRQDAIKYICEKAGKIYFPIIENEIFYLQHYLSSNYTIDSSKTKIALAVKSYMKMIGAKNDYLYILSAVRQALLVIGNIRSVYEQLSSSTAPKLLKDILSQIEILLGKLNIKDANHIQNGEPHPLMIFTADRHLRLDEQKAIQDLLTAYYKLEALCSLAQAHTEMRLTFPAFAGTLSIKGLRHPMVNGCKANDITITKEHVLLITGPNMAGKSTFLKSLGLAFVMAYAGIGVAAEYATIPVLHDVLTSINTEDDISSGYSYFYTEVIKVKQIALDIQQHPGTLVIADELFKGTNVKDAGDCTQMVIDGFITKPQGLFVVATHLTETVSLYEHNPACRLLCFDGSINDGTIQFDYRLHDGISTTRLGKYIMQQERIGETFGLC